MGSVIRFQAPQLPDAAAIQDYFAVSEQSRWYSNRGPCHDLLVSRMKRYLGGDLDCVPVANATLGLMVALRAMVGFEPSRRRVIMPSFTFAAVADAVLWAGLEPVFADVDGEAWHLDVASLGETLTARATSVTAILAASTFGSPPPSSVREGWEELAAQAGFPLLVDSAAGFGALDDAGRRLGMQGAAEVFSFHATKPFAIGEGGLVTTADRELHARMARLVNFGFHDHVVDDEIGLNAKLAEWPAAVALAALDRHDTVLASRRWAAETILNALAPHGYVRQAASTGSTWQFVPVLAPSAAARERAIALGRDRGIEMRSYFHFPCTGCPPSPGMRATLA